MTSKSVSSSRSTLAAGIRFCVILGILALGLSCSSRVSCEDIERKAKTVCGGLYGDNTRPCMPYFTPTEQQVALNCMRAFNAELANGLLNMQRFSDRMR